MTDVQSQAYNQAISEASDIRAEVDPVLLSARGDGLDSEMALKVEEFMANQQTMPRFQQSQMAAGLDRAQGQFYKGIGEVAEAAGFDGLAETLLGWSKQNMEDSMTDRTGLMNDVLMAAGQVGLPIGATLGAAMAAPVLGLSAAVGGTMAGLAASWGMTAGDFFSKEEELDADYEPTLTDFALATALTAPESILLGKGLKILKPLGEAVTSTAATTAAQSGAKFGSTAGKYVKEIAKTSAQSGVIEGSQDAAGSILAHIQTGTELDAARLESIGRASAYEGLIGGILGAPLGAGVQFSKGMAEKQAAFEEDYTAPEAVPLSNEQGQLSEEFKMQPVGGAPKQAGLFSLGANLLLGNSTDMLRQKFGHVPKVNAVLDSFHVRFGKRGKGHFTVNEKARAVEAQFQTAIRDYNKSSREARIEAVKAVQSGVELDTPAYKSLTDTLHRLSPELVQKYSKGEIDITEGLFMDDTYLPHMVNMDWSRLEKSNWEQVRESAMQDLLKQGLTEAEANVQVGILQNAIKAYRETGDHLSYAKQRNQNSYMAGLEARITKYREDNLAKALKGKFEGDPNKLTRKQTKALKNSLNKTSKSEVRQSPLTLERMLDKYSSEFLGGWQKDEDMVGAVNAHIRMISEHLAMVDTFGVDNRIFDEAMISAAVDANNAGTPMTEADFDKFYDVLRTQQRIHLKPITTPRVRQLQNNTRAALNTMLLGLSALVSIPEAMVIFMNTGGKNALKGLGQTVRELSRSKRDRTALAAEELGYTIRTAIDHGINRTGEESYEVSTWENQFIRWTGLPYLQHFLTVWAARANDVHIKGMMESLKTQTDPAKRSYTIRKIEEAGLDVNELENAMQSDNFEQTDYFKDKYIPAVVALTNDTIVDPHPIDKPLWMNDERLLLLTQLKGFMTVFTNRVMRGWKDKVKQSPEGNMQLATKVAPYVAMYIAAQVGMQAVRELLKGGDLDEWDDKEIEERIFSAFGYLGGMAYFVDVYNSIRYRSDPTAAVAGPAASKANRIAGHTVELMEDMDAEGFVNNMLMELFPNMPFKDVMLEAIGAE